LRQKIVTNLARSMAESSLSTSAQPAEPLSHLQLKDFQAAGS